MNSQLYLGHFKDSLERLTFAGRLPASPPGADALTSAGQGGKPDEGFSSADLSLQHGSLLPPTRSMINPAARQRLLSPPRSPPSSSLSLCRRIGGLAHFVPLLFLHLFFPPVFTTEGLLLTVCWFTLLPSNPSAVPPRQRFL